MVSLYKLIAKTNLKSPTISFPLIFPIIIMLLLSTSVSINPLVEHIDFQTQVNNQVANIFVTVVAVVTMQTGLIGFGFNFMNLRKSVMLRRIGATKLTKSDVIGAMIGYGLTIWLIAVVEVVILFVIFSALNFFYSPDVKISGVDYPKVVGHFSASNINWGFFFLALIIMIIASYTIGIFVCSISKTDNGFQSVIMAYFFIVSLMSGTLLSTYIETWMRWIGFVLPHAYINELFKLSSGIITIGNGSFMNGQTGGQIPLYKFILDIVVPLSVSAVALGATIKYLKFD